MEKNMEEIIAVLNKSNIIVKSKDNIYQLIIPAKVNENLDIEYKIYIENNDKGYVCLHGSIRTSA